MSQVMYLPETPAEPAARIHFDPISTSRFFSTLRPRVEAYLKGKRHIGSPFVAAKAAFYLGLAAALYLLMLFGGFSGAMTLALGIGASVSSILLAINVGHDAAHNTFSRRRWLNQAALNVPFTLVGIDPDLWQLRHTKSHHIFPNVNGCDIDIDSNVFVRLSPNHPRRWYQRYQHVYAPFLYALVGFHSAFVQDFEYLFKRVLANLTNIRHTRAFYVAFTIRKIVFATLAIILPLALLPFAWWQVLLGSFAANAVASFVFIAMLIGTHFAEETAFPEPAANGSLGADFATHAMLTSLDWHPHSYIAQVFAGGGNTHVAHHLFPHLSHAHYTPISRLIEDTARELGLRYNKTTFVGLVASHFAFLRRMGSG